MGFDTNNEEETTPGITNIDQLCNKNNSHDVSNKEEEHEDPWSECGKYTKSLRQKLKNLDKISVFSERKSAIWVDTHAIIQQSGKGCDVNEEEEDEIEFSDDEAEQRYYSRFKHGKHRGGNKNSNYRPNDPTINTTTLSSSSSTTTTTTTTTTGRSNQTHFRQYDANNNHHYSRSGYYLSSSFQRTTQHCPMNQTSTNTSSIASNTYNNNPDRRYLLDGHSQQYRPSQQYESYSGTRTTMSVDDSSTTTRGHGTTSTATNTTNPQEEDTVYYNYSQANNS
jgi:hypothetical protein